MTSRNDISSFKEQIEVLRDENEKLKLLLRNGLTNSDGFSDEEAICVVQLRVLKELSAIRDLTLDEVKKFDLFVKNLRAIRGEVVVVQNINEAETVSTEALFQIVANEEN